MSEKPSWQEKYPKPRNQNPNAVSKEQFLSRLKKGEIAGRDFLLVDLRRNDYEGGTIKGSINLPAQTLYYSLPTILTMCRQAKITEVIWYCGSSTGRGTRAALWFKDLLEDMNEVGIESLILRGGITGWATAGEEYTSFMDEYDASHWQK